ncbi:hypothetical protein AB0I69_37955 [Streptomyces sp. NPDC050508]|uniref:hypothetical protein n=1 Tax=Streptomyces sp. NPDC050508 TaxID=3155405 RepID=UPI0034341CF1
MTSAEYTVELSRNEKALGGGFLRHTGLGRLTAPAMSIPPLGNIRLGSTPPYVLRFAGIMLLQEDM